MGAADPFGLPLAAAANEPAEANGVAAELAMLAPDVPGEFEGLASFDGAADEHPLNENAATITATKAIWALQIREAFIASSARGRRSSPFDSKGSAGA